MLMELGICGPSAQKFSTEYLFIVLGSPSEAKAGQALSFGNIFTFLNCIFVAGARSKSQLYSKAGQVCIWRWISSLIYAWFFPSSSVSSPVPLCSCSDKHDRDFVIRSLPSHGVPAVFCLQLSSRGWGSFAFTMLHTALNCVGKAKYCRPDAAFPLLFISLENNLTPEMELCSAEGSCSSSALCAPSPLAEDYFHCGLIVWDCLFFFILGYFGGLHSSCITKASRIVFIVLINIFKNKSLKQEWQYHLLAWLELTSVVI